MKQLPKRKQLDFSTLQSHTTAFSRKVVGKNGHATIPKGNMGCDQYTVPDRQSPRGRDVFRHYHQPSGDFCQNRQFRQNRQSPRGHFWHPVQFVRGWRFFAIFAIACLFMKCRTHSSCFPLALAKIRPWPLVPFFQISLKNTELKTTHNAFGGIVACIFSDNFLEIAVCAWMNIGCVARIAMDRLFWCSSIRFFAACRFSFLSV